jgi:hypothetical protein
MTGYESKKAAARDKMAQPAQKKNPETFERWLAKQHGDPEEIGFLQALRIAYIAGQDSVTTPSDIEAEIAQIEKQRQELEAWANSVWEARATHGWRTRHHLNKYCVVRDAQRPWVGLTDED